MQPFTIYLAKPGYNAHERYSLKNDVVTENVNSIFDVGVTTLTDRSLTRHLRKNRIEKKLLSHSQSNTSAYYKQSGSFRPWWADFWNVQENVSVVSAACLSVREIKGNLFALIHGSARTYLNMDAFESDFGLKTAANMVHPDRIRSADVFTPSEIGLRTRKQTNKNATLNQYDLDRYSSLLKNLAGKSRDRYKALAATVQGTDSLRINGATSVDQLDKKLRLLRKLYSATIYKKAGLAWIDNYRPIKDHLVIDKLDKELVQALNAQDPEISLSLPMVLDVERSIYFQYRSVSRTSAKTNYENLEIENYYDILKRDSIALDVDLIQKHRLFVFEYDVKAPMQTLTLKRCIYFETKLGRTNYFLEAGVWYEISGNFFKAIEAQIAPLIAASVDFGWQYNHAIISTQARRRHINQEYIYNEELAGKLSGKTALLDTKIVHLGHDKIEICDVLRMIAPTETWLIHVKKNYGANSLSHLFSQAVVSIKALLDKTFLEKANKKISDATLQFPTDLTKKRSQYVIVFGIIQKKPGSKHLPLFSRINLDRCQKELEALGFRTRIAFIDRN